MNPHIPDEILPGLWLGSQHVRTENEEFIKSTVTHIVDASNSGISNGSDNDTIIFHNVNLDDSLDSQLPFHGVSIFIRDAFNTTTIPTINVLVLCNQGISRSAALVMGYLIEMKGYTLKQAFFFVKNKRKIVLPNRSFMEQLKQLELKVHKCSTLAIKPYGTFKWEETCPERPTSMPHLICMTAADRDTHLSKAVRDVLTHILNNDVEYPAGISKDLHERSPYVPKPIWNRLGDAIQLAERPTHNIPGDRWISLRCDGHGFSKLTKQLTKFGVFDGDGYSPTMARIMVQCCHALMETFNAKCGYTQSDEITVLIEPTSLRADEDGVHHPHMYNGRVQKLCSLAAATVSAVFTAEILKIMNDQSQNQQQPRHQQKIPRAIFDCRVGSFECQDDAVALILWRGMDCGINGVSDAVYKTKGKIEGAGKMVKESTNKKLIWLANHNLLPLADHQRDGSYFVKSKVVVDAINRATGTQEKCLRSRSRQILGNIIANWKSGKLFPEDDAL